jgi:FMN phosphatase YigB (HAD superfamily)
VDRVVKRVESPSEESRIQHVWFDLNGTLTRETAAYRAALANVGHVALADALGLPVDSTIIELYDKLYRHHGTKSAIFKALGKGKDYWPSRFASLDQLAYLEPDEEISDTLNRLSGVVPISLLSNSRMEKVEATLAAVQISMALFTCVLTSSDIPNPKPALDGFELIVSRSKLPPDKILFVGDRESADIVPARSVGLRTALVWGESALADYSFMTISEILRIFPSGEMTQP